MEAIDRVEEEESAYPLVEVIALAPQPVEGLTFGQQFLQRGLPAKGIERVVANRRLCGGDNFNQFAHA
jgi:hypothetical protein